MPVRQIAPVSRGDLRQRLLVLLDARRQRHVRAANDLSRKLGERIDSAAQAKECQDIRQLVRAMRDE